MTSNEQKIKEFKRLYGFILLGVALTVIGGLGGTAVSPANPDHLYTSSVAQTLFALMAFGGLLMFLISVGWVIVKLVRS